MVNVFEWELYESLVRFEFFTPLIFLILYDAIFILGGFKTDCVHYGIFWQILVDLVLNELFYLNT